MTDKKDLELLMLGHTPIFQIESHEERRALGLLVDIATRNMLPVFQWSITEGLKRLDIDLGIQRHNAEPDDVLGHIKSSGKDGIYVLLDFNPYIKDPKITRYLKEIAMQFDGGRNKLVLLSHEINVPASLNSSVVRFELSLPGEEDLIKLVIEEGLKWQKETGIKVNVETEYAARMVNKLKGINI